MLIRYRKPTDTHVTNGILSLNREFEQVILGEIG